MLPASAILGSNVTGTFVIVPRFVIPVGFVPICFPSTIQVAYILAVDSSPADTVTSADKSLTFHFTDLSVKSEPPLLNFTVALNLLFVVASADTASSFSATGVSAASSENVSVAGVSTATDASEPSLNSAAHTGTLEVASIATTSDILNVFFAMPFFVFLIFVMIIVPLWVVDRLIFD